MREEGRKGREIIKGELDAIEYLFFFFSFFIF